MERRHQRPRGGRGREPRARAGPAARARRGGAPAPRRAAPAGGAGTSAAGRDHVLGHGNDRSWSWSGRHRRHERRTDYDYEGRPWHSPGRDDDKWQWGWRSGRRFLGAGLSRRITNRKGIRRWADDTWDKGNRKRCQVKTRRHRDISLRFETMLCIARTHPMIPICRSLSRHRHCYPTMHTNPTMSSTYDTFVTVIRSFHEPLGLKKSLIFFILDTLTFFSSLTPRLSPAFFLFSSSSFFRFFSLLSSSSSSNARFRE